MAAEISDLTVVDASNTARFPEGQNPSTVNNGARATEGLLARAFRDTIDGILTTGGSSTAYTVTLNRTSVAAWYNGLRFTVKFHTASGATPTINPTGSGALGAKSLYFSNGTQVTTGLVPQNSIADCVYDSTLDKVLINLTGAVSGAITASGYTQSTARLLGRTTAATGAIEEITVAASLTFSSGALSGTAASDTQAGVAELAVQSEMEAATDTGRVPPVSALIYHPGIAKATGNINYNSGTPSLLTDFGVTGIADTATGRVTITLDNTFSAANAMHVTGGGSTRVTNGTLFDFGVGKTTTTFEINMENSAGTLVDAPGNVADGNIAFAVFGDLA